jgi:hypothetical protein
MLSFVVQIDARTSAAGSPVSVSYGGDVFSATVWGGGPLVPVTMTLHMHTQPCSSGLVGLTAFCLPVIATLETTAASGASSVQCVGGTLPSEHSVFGACCYCDPASSLRSEPGLRCGSLGGGHCVTGWRPEVGAA